MSVFYHSPWRWVIYSAIIGLTVFNRKISSLYAVRNKLGCLYSGDLCFEYEVCVDDGLFGTCRDSMVATNVKSIRLRSGQAKELNQVMDELVDNNYTWHDDYSQCVVKYYVQKYSEEDADDVEFPKICKIEEEEKKMKEKWSSENSEKGIAPYSNLNNRYSSYEQQPIQTNLYRNLYRVGLGDQREQQVLPDYESGEVGKYVFTKNDIKNLKENMDINRLFDEMSENDLDRLRNSIVGNDPDELGYETPPNSNIKVNVVYKPDLAEKNKQTHYSPILNVNEEIKGKEIKQDEQNENINNEPEEINSELSNLPANPATVTEPPPNDQNINKFMHNTHGHLVPNSRLLYNRLIPHHHNNYLPVSNHAVFSKNGMEAMAKIEQQQESSRMSRNRQKYLVTMYVLCIFVVVSTFLAVVLYFVRRRSRIREKFNKWVNKDRQDSTGDYQDLCRHHMQSRLSEKPLETPTTSGSPLIGQHNKGVTSDWQSSPPIAAKSHPHTRTSSTNSSTSSWNEEPVNPNMDISTGHLILAYMEDHIRNKDRLQREWLDICSNDGEPCSIVAGIEPMNMRKNRCTDTLPYEHSRVKLNPSNNVSGYDYINANFIIDHDPRSPTYIATQGPLPHTVADFWQMVWEQNSVVIVNLTRLWEQSNPICHRYWPEEGTDLYHVYEVQLISEHMLCEDFVIRSMFLKNLQASETRTITQFHFLTWPDQGVPASPKALLDFRRKVNKSYRGRMSPITVHCSDGSGRTGTYCLIDMTLNRLSKGAKEIDIAAALEHLRDQRVNMVRTKEQFEFALSAVAEEVHMMLNSNNNQ